VIEWPRHLYIALPFRLLSPHIPYLPTSMDEYEERINEVRTVLEQLHMQQARHFTCERDGRIKALLKYLHQLHNDAIDNYRFGT
jgi:hypothetical protein